jgi:hypothetical protein
MMMTDQELELIEMELKLTPTKSGVDLASNEKD